MFDAWATVRMIRDSVTLSHHEKLVGTMLVSRCDEHGFCFPSFGQLALDCDLSRRTIVKTIQGLTRSGHLKSIPRTDGAGDRSSNQYDLRGWCTPCTTRCTTDTTVVHTVHHGGAHRALGVVHTVHPKIPNGRSPSKNPLKTDPESDDSARTSSVTSVPVQKPKKTKPSTVRARSAGPERTDEQRAAHAEVTAAYFAAFEAERKVRPAFGARDGVAVYELLVAVGWDVLRATAAIRNGLARGAWPADATIRTIATDPSRYLTAPRKAGSAGPVQSDHGPNPYFSLESHQ